MNKINNSLLVDFLFHPKFYGQLVGIPGSFDVAEYLFENHFENLSARVVKKVESVLLRSGKYRKKNV